MRLIAMACLLGGFLSQAGTAQQTPAVLGTISSTSPVIIGGIAMSPSGSASWPVVEKDEIATQAPALLTTADHNFVTFDHDTKIRLNTTEAKQTYIFMRQGGLAFDAASSRIFICIGNRLFVPETQAKGVLRMDNNGSLVQRLDRGVFAEQGSRSCNETGPGSFLSGAPGAAGGSAGAAPAGTTVVYNRRVITGAAIGAGLAVAAAFAFSSGSCATAGCNTNPPPLSAIQP